VLRPTSSVSLARRRLERLSVGGTTPLTHGLMAGYKVVKTELLRDPTIRPLLVLISDGRGNISMFKEEPLVEAQKVAALIDAEDIDALVIDSARDYSHLPSVQHLARVAPMYQTYAINACADLAERMGAHYYGLYDLSSSWSHENSPSPVRDRADGRLRIPAGGRESDTLAGHVRDFDARPLPFAFEHRDPFGSAGGHSCFAARAGAGAGLTIRGPMLDSDPDDRQRQRGSPVLPARRGQRAGVELLRQRERQHSRARPQPDRGSSRSRHLRRLQPQPRDEA